MNYKLASEYNQRVAVAKKFDYNKYNNELINKEMDINVYNTTSVDSNKINNNLILIKKNNNQNKCNLCNNKCCHHKKIKVYIINKIFILF